MATESAEITEVLKAAIREAEKRSHDMVVEEHLLLALLDDETVRTFVLPKVNADPTASRMAVDLYLQNVPIRKAVAGTSQIPNRRMIQMSPEIAQIRHLAIQYADMRKSGTADVFDLLAALAAGKHSLASKLLNNLGLSPEVVQQCRPNIRRPKMSLQTASDFLVRIAVDLVDMAKAGKIDPVIGRDREMAMCWRILAKRRKNNVILVGRPGVGKTSIVEGLALAIASGNAPDLFTGTPVFSVEGGSLVAGTRMRGDMEERVAQLIDALQSVAANTGRPPILFLDEIHMLIGAGAASDTPTTSISNLLRPALLDGSIRFVGATTEEEYQKYVSRDRAFARRFEKIEIGEPDPETTRQILEAVKPLYENFHGTKIGDGILGDIVEIAGRFVGETARPDSAVDILDSAAAAVRIGQASKVDVPVVAEVVSGTRGIDPALVMGQARVSGGRVDIETFEAHLRKWVFGQEEAIRELVDAVAVSKAGLADPERPLGVFLFNGPTGVGKTELAKRMAEGLGLAFLRIDMSELSEEHSVAKLVGAPPGYVGYGNASGRLTSFLTSHPHAVVLLDEFEKAHQNVWNLFLQVFDAGRITGGDGRTVDARKAWFVITGNIGTKESVGGNIGFVPSDRESKRAIFDRAIEKTLSPELRNRIGAVVQFAELDRSTVRTVLHKFLSQIEERARTATGTTLTVTGSAEEWLIDRGWNPEMGARPLARVVERWVSRPLARLLLSPNPPTEVVVGMGKDGPTVVPVESVPLVEVEMGEGIET